MPPENMLKDRIIEEAVELALRFPDMSDYDMLDAVGWIVKKPLESHTVLGQLAITAYETDEATAKRSPWYR